MVAVSVEPDRDAPPQRAQTCDDIAAIPEERMPLRELDAYARAEVALHRIRRGSDPAQEAFDLANTLNDEFVRRLVARLRTWLRPRRVRRRGQR